jgi:ribosomal protein L29
MRITHGTVEWQLKHGDAMRATLRDSKDMSIDELKADIKALKASKARLVAAHDTMLEANRRKRRQHKRKLAKAARR